MSKTTSLRSLSQLPGSAVEGTNFLQLKASFRIWMVVLDWCSCREMGHICSEPFWWGGVDYCESVVLGKTADGFKSVCTLWIWSWVQSIMIWFYGWWLNAGRLMKLNWWHRSLPQWAAAGMELQREPLKRGTSLYVQQAGAKNLLVTSSICNSDSQK